MRATRDGRGMPEFAAAVAEVRAQIDKTVKQRFNSVAQFQEFDLGVDTMPVRGIVCMLAEIGQQAVSDSCDPLQDGAFLRVIELADCAHAANDCPKKFQPSTVI